jgi:ribosomal protein S28E/S33
MAPARAVSIVGATAVTGRASQMQDRSKVLAGRHHTTIVADNRMGRPARAGAAATVAAPVTTQTRAKSTFATDEG